MCKFSDLRYMEVVAESDQGWFTTRLYSIVFTGHRGFFDEEFHSQLTSYGPELYDGKQAYWCKGCVQEFYSFSAAQIHVDEEPDENPNILGWFGIN